jgi:hypothetical protein
MIDLVESKSFANLSGAVIDVFDDGRFEKFGYVVLFILEVSRNIRQSVDASPVGRKVLIADDPGVSVIQRVLRMVDPMVVGPHQVVVDPLLRVDRLESSLEIVFFMPD